MSGVQALVSLVEYQGGRANLFPSVESVRWFIRRNKCDLVNAGALLEIAGRVKIEPLSFDAVVLIVGKRAAQREVA